MEQRVVKIGATITEEFMPDRMKIYVDIEGRRKDREDSVKAYTSNLNFLLAQLYRAGVTKKEIAVDQLSIHPCFEWGHKGVSRSSERITGYKYHGYLEITIDNYQERFDKVWGALVSTSPEVSFRIDFILKDEDDARKSLMRKAVREGERRARVLVEAAHAKLGGIAGIQYDFHGDSFEDAYGAVPVMDGAIHEQIMAPELSPSPIEVSCTVRMEWEIL